MQNTTLRRDALLIFITLLIAYVYVLPRWSDWSQNSRLNLVRALVEQRTTSIDGYVANTGDYALYNGRTFTDKPPGLSFVALPLYAAALPLIDHPAVMERLEKLAGGGALAGTLNPEGSGLRADKVRHFVAQAMLSAATVALPAAALGALIFLSLAWLGFGRGVRLLATLGYGLATPAAAYAGNFYSHQFVAALLFGAFALLLTADPARRGIGWARALLFGLLCSYALISEYPIAIVLGALGVYALFRLTPGEIGLAALGALPPLALMAVYNLASFGTPLPVGYAHSALWQEQHNTGFMSITYPRPEALWGLTFGTFRGLFVRAPWLILALPGFLAWWRAGERRGAWWVSLVSVAGLTLFYASSVMWWGGFGVGPRYLVPMLPFLVLPAAYALRALWATARGRSLCVALVALSAALTWAEALAGQSFPSDALRQPWLSHTLPAWLSGDIARNLGTALGLDGAASLAPLLAIIALSLALLLWPRRARQYAHAGAGPVLTPAEEPRSP